MNPKKHIGGGLIPVDKKRYSQRYSLGALFPTIDIATVPTTDFIIGTPKIKNQGVTDYCTAFSTSSASELQEGIELDPLYTFSRTKALQGNTQWGADLFTAAKSHIQYGALEKQFSPFTIDSNRDDIINLTKWPENSDQIAKIHQKQAYFSVDGQKTDFDSIRAALWQYRAEKRAVVVGMNWRHEWTNAPNGIIPRVYGQDGTGHAFMFIGQKTINGILYLVAQLSNTEEIGDKGLFYFDSVVTNKELNYGKIMFKDLPAEHTHETAVVQSQYYRADWIGKALITIIGWLKSYFGEIMK